MVFGGGSGCKLHVSVVMHVACCMLHVACCILHIAWCEYMSLALVYMSECVYGYICNYVCIRYSVSVSA